MKKEFFNQARSVSSMVEDMKKQRESQSKKDKENKIKKISEVKKIMEELGVTSIFEELRDNEKLVYYRDTGFKETSFAFGFRRQKRYVRKVYPAIINYSYNDSGDIPSMNASITFDVGRDPLDGSFEGGSIVYVEKRGQNVFVGSDTVGQPLCGYKEIEETKAESKDQIPELIAKAIYHINPSVEMSNPPTSITWIHRR